MIDFGFFDDPETDGEPTLAQQLIRSMTALILMLLTLGALLIGVLT